MQPPGRARQARGLDVPPNLREHSNLRVRAWRPPNNGARLLQQGESIQYVQRMLGHASITLTVDTYGKWLPMGNKAAVDRLDEVARAADGGNLVAEATTGLSDDSEVVEGLGDPGRARTFNPEIKSLLLYH